MSKLIFSRSTNSIDYPQKRSISDDKGNKFRLESIDNSDLVVGQKIYTPWEVHPGRYPLYWEAVIESETATEGYYLVRTDRGVRKVYQGYFKKLVPIEEENNV